MDPPLDQTFVNSAGRVFCLATPADLKSIWRQVSLTRKVDIALDAETLAELRGSKYRELMWHATPAMLHVMDSGLPRKCAIAYEQYANGKDSREAGIWSVIATDDIRTGEPIGVYTGRLETPEVSEEPIDNDSLEHLFFYELPALPSGKELVINGLHACNEMRLLQDPVWAGQRETAPTNVQPKPVWHPTRSIPYIVFTAQRPIKRGDELLISYGEAAWETITRIQLFKWAETAHQWHVRTAILEAHIESVWPNFRADLARELSESDYQPRNSVAVLVPPELRVKKRKEPPPASMESDEDEPVSSAQGFRDPVRPLPTKEWERGECFTLIRKMYCSAEVRKSLQNVKLPPAEMFCWPRLRTLVLEEGRVNKCSVKEIVALSHPVRFATPPNKTCYALVADKKLAKGEPIGLYLGTLRPDRDDYTDEYSYSIMQSQLKGYHGPDLQLSANSLGNETRFINDWWNREGGAKNVNCEAHLVMWEGLPHLLVCTTRTIYPGDEIVTSYGVDFWKPFSMSHMLTLANYSDAMEIRCKKLAEKFAARPGGERLDIHMPVHVGSIFQADALDYSWMPDTPTYLPLPAPKQPQKKKARCGKDSASTKNPGD